MAYTITKSNGGTLILLNDGLTDKQVTSLTLVGKNVSNFGDDQNENFVHLLENFSSAFEPRSPLQGQLWYNTSTNVSRPSVFDGTNWRSIATLLYSNTTTDTLVNAGFNNFVADKPGDFWFNSSNKQLYVITSTAKDMTLIGPEAVPGFGTTKMSSVKIKDTTNAYRPVIEMTVDGQIVGVVSTLTFATNEIDPYNIYKGITLSSDAALSAQTIWAATANAMTLISGQVLADNADITALTSRTAVIDSITGGLINGTTATISNLSSTLINASNIEVNNITANNLIANGTGLITGNWKLNSNGFLTPNIDGSNDIGASTIRFNNVYTKSLSSGNTANAGDITGFWKLTAGSTIAPTTDLGNSLGATNKRFNTIYTTGLSTTNDSTAISIIGSPNVTGHITPSVGTIYDLGSNTNKWAQIYVDNVQTNAVDANEINSAAATFANLSVLDATIGTLIDAYAHTINQFDTDGTFAANSDARFATQRAIKTYVDYVATQLTNLINSIPGSDTDVTLSANSNSRIATQRATKTYVDNTRAALQAEIDAIPYGNFGANQTYENVTVARNFGTSYVNTTGKTIYVDALVTSGDSDWDDPVIWAIGFVNGVEVNRGIWTAAPGAPCWITVNFFVPPGASYYINIYCPDEPPNQLSYGQSIARWNEFR